VDVLINNTPVQTILQSSLQISRKTDGERSLSVSFVDTLSKVKDGDEVEVFDGTTKLFGGVIKSVSYQLLTPITDREPLIQVDVQSDGYNFIPSRRVTTISFTNSNVKNIVQALLTASNLGLDKITAGTIEDGPEITYNAVWKRMSDILDELAAASGFIWFIDDARRLQFGPMQAIVTSVFELVENGPFTDFSGLSWSGSIENYANRVFVIGDGVSTTRQETSEITEREQEADGQSSGVYGFVIEDSNIKSQTQANTVADNHLRKYAIRPGQLTFNSYSAGWLPGTKLKVQLRQITGINPTFPTIANVWYYVIEEVSLTSQPGGLTEYSISAVRRQDANFSTQKTDGFVSYFKQIVTKE
jgi:hypothetical protein